MTETPERPEPFSAEDRIAQLEARIYQLNRFVSSARQSFNKKDPAILGEAIATLNDQNRTIAAGSSGGARLIRSSLGEPVSQEAPEVPMEHVTRLLVSLPTWIPIPEVDRIRDSAKFAVTWFGESGIPLAAEVYDTGRIVWAGDATKGTADNVCEALARIIGGLEVAFPRSAFSGIPRTENEPCTCALAGLDATTHDGHLADCPKYVSSARTGT